MNQRLGAFVSSQCEQSGYDCFVSNRNVSIVDDPPDLIGLDKGLLGGRLSNHLQVMGYFLTGKLNAVLSTEARIIV